jgi:hypothetical protein
MLPGLNPVSVAGFVFKEDMMGWDQLCFLAV